MNQESSSTSGSGSPGAVMRRSYKAIQEEQDRFDCLVKIRLERDGETLESAIAWAAQMKRRYGA
jgi:hypothetical protein